MDAGSPGRAVAIAYVLVVSAVAVALILVGALVDRLTPAAVRDGYERAMFATLGWLARPVDALASRPADREPAG